MTVLFVASCFHSTVEPLQPLTLQVDASRTTAAPGDTVSFVVDMQGGSLIGVELNYGDGAADQYGTSGARTAHVTFKHAFAARGTYTVLVTATDAFAGQKDASVKIVVN